MSAEGGPGRRHVPAFQPSAVSYVLNLSLSFSSFPSLNTHGFPLEKLPLEARTLVDLRFLTLLANGFKLVGTGDGWRREELRLSIGLLELTGFPPLSSQPGLCKHPFSEAAP